MPQKATIRRLAHGSPDYDAAVALRRRILRTPLGLDFTPEQLAAEAADTHLAAFIDGVIAATVVLSPYDATALKLRQMAVDPALQGQAVGAQLLSAAEDHARADGKARIVLSARVTAEGFYARHGYVRESEVFTEVTIPHVRMAKNLA